MDNIILEKLGKNPFDEISMGYQTLTFYPSNELDKAQVGYSVDDNGNDLTGTSDGDWKSNWLVIGYDDIVGDPIFIDLNEDNVPVFTSQHGTGEWVPYKLADSFAQFVESLKIIKEASANRETPDQLEENKVNFWEKRKILKRISKVNSATQKVFWEKFLMVE